MNETNQIDKIDQKDKTDRSPPFSYISVLGQTTQNPELITQNFPKPAGCFLARKGGEVGCLHASLTDLPEQGDR